MYTDRNDTTGQRIRDLVLYFLCYGLCLLLTFVASLSAAGHTHAETTTTDLVARIQQKYASIQSLRAEFVQESRSLAASLSTTAHGKLYFRKPRAMRWQYKEPRQWFLVLEDKAWHYVPADMTVYERLIRSPEVLNLFSGLDRVRETFRITRLPDTPDSPMRNRLELLPLEAEFPVRKVKLWVDPTSYLVVRIQTEDPLGNLNEISFDNIELNPALESNLFRLQIPDGARVDREDTSPP
ncbi:MAG: outer membrane lipoprotein carrier protein LolA [Deltaproteobacteria bacterium]|nr:MAG: outer membrane lipoprotein carrier protein LolA [Deltaproteobacteria bacterium]